MFSHSSFKKYQPSAFASTGYNPTGSKQFVATKFRYSNKKESHLDFIKTYLTQESKKEVIDKPVLFSKDDSFDINDYINRATDYHFKFILSPESNSVPLNEYTKVFTEKIEKELNLKFDWVAAVHTDTGHNHAHVLINGVDRDGERLPRIPFSKSFIKNRVHIISQDIATEMIGERTAEQKRNYYDRSFTANRLTQHDKKISQLTNGRNFLATSDATTRKRLSHLNDIGLVKYDANKQIYYFQNNWYSTLVDLGRYNSLLKAREELKYTLPEDLELFNRDYYNSKGKSFTGIVRKTYSLDEEYENNNAVVLENENGQAVFVPLFKPPPPNITNKRYTVIMNEKASGQLVPRFINEENSVRNNRKNTIDR